MDDTPRKPNYRKLMIGALIAAAGLALCAGIVFVTIGAFRTFQEGREAFNTLQEALQGSPQEAREVSRADRGVSEEAQMVGIVPSPRIVQLNDVGDSQMLTVQGYYSDGSVGDLEKIPGASVSYVSSESSVVRVDSGGVVTGTKAGGADVVVSYGSLEATVPVLVWGEVRRVPPIDPDRLLEIDHDGSAIVLNRVMVELKGRLRSNGCRTNSIHHRRQGCLRVSDFPRLRDGIQCPHQRRPG